MPRERYRLLVLGVMSLVLVFNFVDRQILGILAGSIKRDLGLSDAELGLMGGLAFATVYSAALIPVAALADRWGRSSIISGALAVWSGFTALCGLAGGFWSLFLCRMGVGLGEAGGIAPAYSLISDYFPKAQQARALAAYSLGVPIGAAIGILFGGLIAHLVDWRWAFISIGLVGLAFAPLVRWVVRESPRATSSASLGEIARHIPTLLAKPSFWLVSFGAAASSVSAFGVAFWLPSFFERSLGMSLVDRSLFLGAIYLVGGGAGVWFGGWLGDRLGRAKPAAYLLAPAVAFVVAFPCFALAMQSTSLPAAFILFLVPTGLNLAWNGPVLVVVQHLAPAAARATGTACFLLVNNLVGQGLGAWMIGALSDMLTPRYGDEALRYALLCGLSFYLVSAALFALAARRVVRDWVVQDG